MEKFLYFAEANGANASGEAAMYPATSFRGADVGSNTLKLFFKPLQIGDAVAAGDVNDAVLITCGANQKAVLKIIAEHIAAASGPLQVPMITIADMDNSLVVSPLITAVEITLAA